jgi:hypothetical protein
MDSSPPTFTAGMIVPMGSSGVGRAQTKSSSSSIELEHTSATTILHRPGLLREHPAYKRRQLQLEVSQPGSDQNHGADIEVLLLSYFMNSGLNLHAQRANLYCLIPSLSRRTIVLRSNAQVPHYIYFRQDLQSTGLEERLNAMNNQHDGLKACEPRAHLSSPFSACDASVNFIEAHTFIYTTQLAGPVFRDGPPPVQLDEKWGQLPAQGPCL